MKVAFSILATAALAAAQSNPLNSIPDCAVSSPTIVYFIWRFIIIVVVFNMY